MESTGVRVEACVTVDWLLLATSKGCLAALWIFVLRRVSESDRCQLNVCEQANVANGGRRSCTGARSLGPYLGAYAKGPQVAREKGFFYKRLFPINNQCIFVSHPNQYCPHKPCQILKPNSPHDHHPNPHQPCNLNHYVCHIALLIHISHDSNTMKTTNPKVHIN